MLIEHVYTLYVFFLVKNSAFPLFFERIKILGFIKYDSRKNRSIFFFARITYAVGRVKMTDTEAIQYRWNTVREKSDE